MAELTSVESFYAELYSGKIGEKQQEVLDFAIAGAIANPTDEFTRQDIKRYFRDARDSYVPRARELYDRGLLEHGTVAEDSRTRRKNNSWRVAPRVLEGDRTPIPFLRATKLTNRRLLLALRDLIHMAFDHEREGHVKTARKYTQMAEAMIDMLSGRMKTGTLRKRKTDEPIRVKPYSSLAVSTMGGLPIDLIAQLIGEEGKDLT